MLIRMQMELESPPAWRAWSNSGLGQGPAPSGAQESQEEMDKEMEMEDMVRMHPMRTSWPATSVRSVTCRLWSSTTLSSSVRQHGA